MALVDSQVLRVQSSKYLLGRGTNRIWYPSLRTNFCARPRIPKLNLTASMWSLADHKSMHSTKAGKDHVAWQSVKEERCEGELEVDGNISKWLNGTYLRNGPGVFHIDNYNVNHLFDGYATLVRVQFDNGEAKGGHAMLQSEAYMTAKRNNRICHREFSESPKPSNLLSCIGYLVGMVSGASVTDNACIAVVSLGDGRVMCLTETTKGFIQIDPNTLETIGRFNYTDNLGWINVLQSGHPMISESELITVLPDLVNPGYNVVRMLAGTNERTIIGRVSCRGGHAPGWVHSFAVTENYIIIPEMPLKYSIHYVFGGDVLKWWPESKAFVHVVSRVTRLRVTSIEVPLFMTMHFINAYEERQELGKKSSIIVDCCEYNADYSIIDRLKLQALRSFSGEDVLPNSRIGRFTLPLDGSASGKLDVAFPPEKHGRGIDMCNINKKYVGKMYRYIYGCTSQRPCNALNTLTKIDLEKKVSKSWYIDGGIPSEPCFVARPGAKTEDDGVVKSIVSDKYGDGFVVILDGSTFKEIARAKFVYGLPFGTHGC
ncbi:carotenoid cleavage dioxygenase 8 homolog B, chloroplastic-like [Cryptomeria japonica]|uniref:carotenoid cleavage dioxygenase 8 homolog B, chloroplastic-like n=1 Tax=Cryptomeria japonica TaxID=3369 RepID=UPI0027DA9DE0|nr:carotenoid cleavage dioxygenase 8 homolog B, chloroplastic-like [Cryptomeria japonica]